MYKLKLFLLPVALLLAFMAFACAPPDDNDDNGAPSSGPTINNAIYDFATALLTVQGTDLSPTEAQIQTIVVGSQTNGVALSSYTADEDATGPNSNSLAKGKYRIKTDGTALWLRLTDRHKAALQAKLGSDGLKKGLLSVGSGAWAGLNTAKDLDVRNVPGKQSPKQAEQTEQQSPKQAKVEQDEQAEQAKQTEEVEDKQSKTETEDQSLKLPEAAITRATYNVGTALLTVQGTHLSPTSATQAQIQTITVAGLALSSYIADGTATGPDSRGLAKGKYRIKGDGTALWLYLTDPHKATLNGKDGMDSNGLKDGLLSVGTGAWAGLDAAKALAVSGNPAPTITRATYNVGTALLTVQGTDLASATQAQIQTIVVDGLALSSYTADATATGPDSRGLAKGKYRMHSAGTALWLYLTDTDKTTLNGKTGMDSNGLKDGLLSVGTGAWAGLDTAKALAVSGNPPAITSATYNAATAVLVITGVNLPSSVYGWDFSKLRLVAGNGRKSQPLLRHRPTGRNRATGSNASATSLTITLKGSEYTKASNILVKNGDSDDAGAYNLEAAAGFAGGSAADTSNPITVSGYVVRIDDAYYSVSRGILWISGSGLPSTVEEWDFSKLTLVSGDGNKRYTLPRHSTVGENTATGSNAIISSLTITLSGNVKAEVEKILVKNGKSDDTGAYNLKVAAGFVMGGSADPTNAIEVIGVVE